MKHPLPDEIRVRSGRAALGLVYGGETFDLPAEFLRVYSPSAQVRGHGPGQEVLQTGKKDVLINDIEPCTHWHTITTRFGRITCAASNWRVRRAFRLPTIRKPDRNPAMPAAAAVAAGGIEEEAV